MLRQPTLFDSIDVISSLELADGNTPSTSPDGPQIGQSGPEVAHASLTQRLASKKAMRTNATSGQTSSGSSASVALTRSLVNKLQALLGTDGSMEFSETWKEKVTPLGIAYSEHTASARRTSGSGCTGWPTARAEDAESAGTRHGRGVSDTLTAVAKLTGWVSPSSRDWKDTPGMSNTGTNPDGSTRTRVDQLPRQVHGLIQSPSNAATVSRVVSRLNPAMSRWLMGFPDQWDHSSPGWSEWATMQKLLAQWFGQQAETEPEDCAATETQ